MICAAHKILFLWTSRKMRWAGHVACVGQKRSDYKILVGKREGKRPLGRRRGRWKDIEIELKEIGSEVVDRTRQAHDRDTWRAVVNTVMNLQVPCDCVQFLSSCCCFALFSGKFVMFWALCAVCIVFLSSLYPQPPPDWLAIPLI